jgi:membrane protease YdiL (CAAX protease family)
MVRVQSRPAVDRGCALAALAGALAVWNNAVAPRLSRVPGGYEVGNGAAALALLAAARVAGLPAGELGLHRDRLASGLRWGGPPSALVLVGCAAAAVVPGLHPLVRDARVAGLDRGAVVYRLGVRVPVGTVLWEEIAFRGVLHAALSRAFPAPVAIATGAGLFGVWHVRPSLDALRANGLARTRAGTAAAVLAACAGTAASGVLFAELRRRSGSLIAPTLLHLAANDGGLLAAVAAQRSTGPGHLSSGSPV